MSHSVTDGEQLLQSILDEPDNNDLRLIYADYLDENGEPERAEVIRLQVKILQHYAQNPIHDDQYCEKDCQAKGWEARVREILLDRVDLFVPETGEIRKSIRYETWTAPFSRGVAWPEWIDRGFVSCYRGPYRLWRQFGPEFVTKHPVVSVIVTNMSPFGWRRGYEHARFSPASPWGLDYDLDVYNYLDSGAIRRVEYNPPHAAVIFHDEKVAAKAISDALLKWAKAQPYQKEDE